jgi:hypothetical protein
MIMTKQIIHERIDWMREQALSIQRQPEDMRSQNDIAWLRWAERRVLALTQEGAAHD